MAEYLIQDTTLDAIADAINAKTGGSSAMTPAQMVTEIGSIQTGGDPWEKMKSFLQNTLTQLPALTGITSIPNYAFYGCSALTDVNFDSIISIGQFAFQGCGLTRVFCKNAIGNPSLYSAFRSNTSLTHAVFTKNVSRFDRSTFEMCTSLVALDIFWIADITSGLEGTLTFYNTPALETLIIRREDNGVLKLNGSFHSTSGLSTTGKFYVPQNLVESYKSATGWSVYADRILPIEGSIYETQYADGTPIPTT